MNTRVVCLNKLPGPQKTYHLCVFWGCALAKCELRLGTVHLRPKNKNTENVEFCTLVYFLLNVDFRNIANFKGKGNGRPEKFKKNPVL